jgi:DNA-binding response OmpR family regulator
MKTRILIVEDDANIRLGLRELLSTEGYEINACDRGDTVLAMVGKFNPQVIILDVMLPGKSGFELCQELRAQHCPAAILMLTAKGQEIDKVIGLDAGADDYLTKPFGVRELLARVQALLRRLPAPSASVDQPFAIAHVWIDPKTFKLKRGSLQTELTARELKLLHYFYQHPGEVLSRDRLLNTVWGYEYGGTTRTLDQVIVQLRKKMGDDDADARMIETVHGVGYRLRSDIAPTP